MTPEDAADGRSGEEAFPARPGVAQHSTRAVDADDLRRFAGRFSDLTDADVMERAWG